MFWVKKVVQRKIEAVYGTDPVPVVGDAALYHEVEMNPYVADQVGRSPIQGWMGHGAKSLPANAKFDMKAFLELGGAGAAGTAPKWGIDMRACGFSQTINVGVDVQYSPVSAAFEAITMYWNNDGQRVRGNGLRGSPRFEFINGQVPKLRVAYTGMPVAPDDTALPVGDFTGWTEPFIVNKVNTPTLTLHGYACALASLEIDIAAVIAFRDWVNAKDVQQTDRKPAGTMTIEAPTIAQKNYFAAVSGAVLAPLQLIHGVGAGNIVQLDAPKVQVANPRYGEYQGLTTLAMDLMLHPNAGNDEFKVTVK